MNVTIVDPKVDEKEVKQKTGLSSLSSIPSHKKYTIIILALYHDEFKIFTKDKLLDFSHKETLIFDLTNSLDGENIINL